MPAQAIDATQALNPPANKAAGYYCGVDPQEHHESDRKEMMGLGTRKSRLLFRGRRIRSSVFAKSLTGFQVGLVAGLVLGFFVGLFVSFFVGFVGLFFGLLVCLVLARSCAPPLAYSSTGIVASIS